MSKKQSSVEWLEQQLNAILKQGNIEIENVIWQQAKAMHKEEIIDAWSNAHTYDKKIALPSQYYKETFGGQDDEN